MTGKPSLSIQDPPLQSIQHALLDSFDVSLSVLRLDLIHPTLGGNKWYKLKRNLQFIQRENIDKVLSFGGVWSNHLLALAAAGHQFGFKTFGVVRGEQIDPPTPVLVKARQFGMTLIPISRQQYREKMDPDFLLSLKQQVGVFYCLPEGGSNELAVRGCQEIVNFFQWQSDGTNRLVMAACGTGGMLSGIILGLDATNTGSLTPSVLGIGVLKAPGYLQLEVENWLSRFKFQDSVNWRIAETYHCGGYAKTNTELMGFLACLNDAIPVPIEPVYTGKLAYGLWQELKSGRIPPGSEVIVVHSGGVINCE